MLGLPPAPPARRRAHRRRYTACGLAFVLLAACGGGGGGGGSTSPGGGGPGPDPEGPGGPIGGIGSLGSDGEPGTVGESAGGETARPGPDDVDHLTRLRVLAVSPPPQDVPLIDAPIEVQFDLPVKRTSVTAATFRVSGRWSGPIPGDFQFSDGDRVVRFLPTQTPSAGDRLTVALTRGLESTLGVALRPAGYTWTFWVRTAPASRQFTTIQVLSLRTTPGEHVQTYGGFAADLDEDGWLDLATTNEVTGDLRVVLNTGDGTGTFDPALTVYATDVQSSPNEPADFDGDGHVDCCVANPNAGTVSILLGNGDGTFQPQQLVTVGLLPRGIVVLDVDGDGDTDIVNTNAASSEISLLRNDGAGHFAVPVFIDTGVAGAWAIAADDLDADGIFDLVVGSRMAQRLLVLKGAGDGTFKVITDVPAGGEAWMITTGDVNGDGHTDVALAGGQSDRGAIVLGDGAGGLGDPVLYATDAWCTATDLGDADGDGDLDWNLSSFFGDFTFYANDGVGAGTFTYDQTLEATAAASCSIFLDLNNDGRLDLALVDELDDTLTLILNGAP